MIVDAKRIPINKQLKVARMIAGYTQGELAKKLGVTSGAVSQWETGRTLPQIEKLKPLAEALNVSVNDLVETMMEAG